MNIHAQRILIIDFGSQYTQIIARRVRELGVYSEIHSYRMSNDDIIKFKPAGIILSGGPESVTLHVSPRVPDSIFSLGVPVLGICYGMQAMALQLGGKVDPGETREFGYAQVALREPSRLLANIEDHLTDDGMSLLDVWMSHGDQVSALPRMFKTIASTSDCPIAGMADEERHFYGLQFHPEVSHTRQGMRIMQHFIYDICGCNKAWTAQNIIDEQITKIREQVGKDGVLLGLSGGVDSSVAALLLHKAIGEQLTCVFVDTGLLRLREAEQIKAVFTQHFGMKLITVNAAEDFFSALAGVDDPEKETQNLR